MQFPVWGPPLDVTSAMQAQAKCTVYVLAQNFSVFRSRHGEIESRVHFDLDKHGAKFHWHSLGMPSIKKRVWTHIVWPSAQPVIRAEKIRGVEG
eukprot:6833930-Pyramimonas_sp.AAC.1